MVDIDGMVMDACAEFMPNVCGKYLKRIHWDGDNYKVINGCAIQFMKDCMVCHDIKVLLTLQFAIMVLFALVLIENYDLHFSRCEIRF